jgi:hypothetical protein
MPHQLSKSQNSVNFQYRTNKADDHCISKLLFFFQFNSQLAIKNYYDIYLIQNV